jgi:hypothetical protein
MDSGGSVRRTFQEQEESNQPHYLNWSPHNGSSAIAKEKEAGNGFLSGL